MEGMKGSNTLVIQWGEYGCDSTSRRNCIDSVRKIGKSCWWLLLLGNAKSQSDMRRGM
jgi:hypothetical protein